MPNLTYNLSKKFDETYTISFTGGPQEITGNGFVFKTTTPVTYISNIKTFDDDPTNETDTVYFTRYFKYKNGNTWSDLLPITGITGLTLNPCVEFELELYYFRTLNGAETVPPTSLYVDNIILSGDYQLSEYDTEAIINDSGDIALLSPVDIYKIFSLSGYQIRSNHGFYTIQYRFTQDNGRTYTDWEPLTVENISTIKLNPLRFAQVEYSITNNISQPLMVYDIILEGDFQNVSANYLKINRYGLKQDCLSVINSTGNGTTQLPGSSNINRDFYTSCLSSYLTYTDQTLSLTNENNSNLGNFWNPYQYDKINSFANFLGNQVSSLLGWTVDYHLTNPDAKGIDRYIHENTLKNVVDMKKIRIVVPDNKFPVETMIINQFNLNLFDTFEIHIMKDEFKNAFGITKRPSEDDIIYICEANMLYYVKHAQAFKNIMNASTFYKIILEKYEQKTNMRNLVEESQQEIDALTDNTTIDNLFGTDMKNAEKQIANKEQTYPTTFDKIRHSISNKVKIVKDSIFMDNFNISKQYYDLSNTTIKNRTAVDYTKIDQRLLKSDNRSFIFWFNFNNGYDPDSRPNNDMYTNWNIKSGVEFNFLNNYTTSGNTNGTGYKMYYKGGVLWFKLNENLYKVTQTLLTNVWYAGVINLNQRQQTLDMYIYRRDAEITTTLINPISFIKTEVEYASTGYTDLISQGYKPVDNTEDDASTDFELITSASYSVSPVEFTIDENLKLLGSDIKFTNLRILNEIIPDTSITNTLKEEILRDEQHIILADNATKQLITTNYYNKNFK